MVVNWICMINVGVNLNKLVYWVVYIVLFKLVRGIVVILCWGFLNKEFKIRNFIY